MFKHASLLSLLLFLLFLQSNASGSSPLFTVDSFPSALDMPICNNKLVYYKIAVDSASNLNYVLDVRNGYLPSGGRIQLWEMWGAANQVFYALSLDKDDPFVYIRTILNHLCVTATIPLTTQNCNSLDLAQRWVTENIPNPSLCSGKQESFLVGKIKNGNTCLGYGTYTSNFTRSALPPQNWNDVAPIPCTNAPNWRLICMS